MTSREYRTRWPEGVLVRAEPSVLEGLNIPEESRRFFVEAGLPNGTNLELRRDHLQEGLPLLSEVAKGSPLPVDGNRYRVMGEDIGTYMCCDVAAHWCIVSVADVGSSLPVAFVNTSVPQLAECLLLYDECIRVLSPLTLKEEDRVLPSMIRRLEKKFRRIDPAAMRDEYCYWSQVLEGMMIL
jgi:hypothetical protein